MIQITALVVECGMTLLSHFVFLFLKKGGSLIVKLDLMGKLIF